MPEAMRRSDMLKKCIEVIDTFDPKRTTVDAYLDDAPTLKDKAIGEVEHKFIHQVFYGCVRYQKLLKMFVTSFLYKCPAVAIRTEQTLYMVLAYLMFFRLEELGTTEFRQFVSSGLGTDSSLLALLRYALCVEDLENWVKMEWCKLYDVKYIEDDIIGKLQSFKAELRPMMEDIELKATGSIADAAAGAGAGQKKKKLCSPRPFNLTKPKPRLVPEPMVISRQLQAKPAPDFGPNLHEVEEEKRQRLAEEVARTNAKYSIEEHFNLETTNRRDGDEPNELARKVEAARMAECTFKPALARPYVPPTEDACVRQNVAAVLREDALLKKKQAKECDILKRYETELHDASGFNEWQQNMKDKDQIEEEVRVRQRIVEMQLAREEAIEAFDGMVRKKRLMAEHQKEEFKIALIEKEHDLHIELEDKKQLVADTLDGRSNARDKEAEVLEARAQNAEEIRKEKEQLFERKRYEDAQEMERRKDLIQQIRAVEMAPVERFKAFDAAEPPCHGFLEEMSLAELRERLKIIESRHAKETEDKRERQLEKKLEKQQEFAEKAESLAKIRDMAKVEAQQRHEFVKARAKTIEERQERHREECILAAADKLTQKKQQKREEELRLRKELKEISTKRQFLQANAEMVEAKAHGEQQLGLEREAKQRQRNLLHDQRRRNEIKSKERVIRLDNQQSDNVAYKVMQDAVTERIQRAKAADVELKDHIRRSNSCARDTQKANERRLTIEVGHSSNAYVKKVSQRFSTAALGTGMSTSA